MKPTTCWRATFRAAPALGAALLFAIVAPAGAEPMSGPRSLQFDAHLAAGRFLSTQSGAAEPQADVPASMTSRQALVPALMSAVLPGSGQIRNGTLLRGFAFAAIELAGWMAWSSFGHQADEKRGDLESFGDRYWEYERYRRVAQNPDSCQTYECPCGLYSTPADSLIQLAQEQGGTRFLDYLTRDAYACGWDTQLSRNLYVDLHGDREDLLDAKSLTGRFIFLNHIVSAVDAFLQARRVRVAGVADVGLRMTGLPHHPHPQLVFTTHFD